ncbi:protein of unknown function [Nitrosospira sp. Nsp14]|uniref:DUF4917 family protein n=1 Tax=Nitrosospira sp. Nsp14 TaxID=1855333 RepID=UPI0008F3C13D|nr:DUF4917 family protein [Nitrosospira sp. Nsp14]SFH58687.1 protein of unknown function [Nitrosospira sp. Nsp14]
MDRIEIDTWANISKDNWSAILLGNGASIAIHKEFAYPTLHSVAGAKGLLPTTAPLFAKLGTTDFEHVLLACWYAEHVNVALRTRSADISAAYAEVRSALIEAVRSVHPVHADVATDLQRVGAFASAFPTLVNLNYDLTLYWAVLLFNAANGSWFKDAFHRGKFQTDWEYLRKRHGQTAGATLVFYPHGSLSVARDYIGSEIKIALSTGAMGDLLETITQTWSFGDYVPVFVSEGTSKEKVAAIGRSHYLTNVYEKVLPALGESLVVYGWSFDERDQHVLDAISVNPPKRLAVSVFTGQPDADQQAFCHQVVKVVSRSLAGTALRFFDSQSPGCWNNP